jgi:hypothetical protein
LYGAWREATVWRDPTIHKKGHRPRYPGRMSSFHPQLISPTEQGRRCAAQGWLVRTSRWPSSASYTSGSERLQLLFACFGWFWSLGGTISQCARVRCGAVLGLPLLLQLRGHRQPLRPEDREPPQTAALVCAARGAAESRGGSGDYYARTHRPSR